MHLETASDALGYVLKGQLGFQCLAGGCGELFSRAEHWAWYDSIHARVTSCTFRRGNYL